MKQLKYHGPSFVEWLESKEVRQSELSDGHARSWRDWKSGIAVKERTADAVCADRGLHLDEIPEWVQAGPGYEGLVKDRPGWWKREVEA